MSGEIDSRVIDYQGVSVTVSLDFDHDTRSSDHDCYSPEDLAAWRRDEWCYVEVTVALTDCPNVFDSLWGVEYGTAPSWSVDMDKIVSEHPVPDMLGELLPQVQAEHAKLAMIMEAWRESGS